MAKEAGKAEEEDLIRIIAEEAGKAGKASKA